MMNFVFKRRNCVLKNEKICIKNDELFTQKRWILYFKRWILQVGLEMALQPTQNTVAYLLRWICTHNKSHNLHLILGLNCAYAFSPEQVLANLPPGALQSRDIPRAVSDFLSFMSDSHILVIDLTLTLLNITSMLLNVYLSSMSTCKCQDLHFFIQFCSILLDFTLFLLQFCSILLYFYSIFPCKCQDLWWPLLAAILCWRWAGLLEARFSRRPSAISIGFRLFFGCLSTDSDLFWRTGCGPRPHDRRSVAGQSGDRAGGLVPALGNICVTKSINFPLLWVNLVRFRVRFRE